VKGLDNNRYFIHMMYRAIPIRY